MSKKPYTLTNRPVCSTRGCKKGCNYKINKKTGSIYWRKTCSTCVNKQVAAKHGLKNIAEVVAKKAGFASVTAYLDHQARAKGFSGLTEYRNSTHSYRKHRKNYCENRDGKESHSKNAEVAAWDADDKWIKLGEDEYVLGWQSPDQVLAIMNRIAAM